MSDFLSAPTLAQAGEFGAIARWASRLGSGVGVRLGIGDDGAVLEALRAPVVSCDALVEGVHFRLDWASPHDIGWKTLAASLSDLAAMGARPAAAFLSLAAPSGVELSWLDSFFAGLDSCARRFGCPLAGGDTTRSPGPLFLSLCAVGDLHFPERPLRREGARPGDVILVTGTLGDSRGGLLLLQGGPENSVGPSESPSKSWLLERHFRPTPRLAEIASALQSVPDGITAALDLSDGLAGDAAHIARASNVSLSVSLAELPVSQALLDVAGRRGWDAHLEAARGGEDYELLLTVRPERASQVRRAIESCGTRATEIGLVQEPGEAHVLLLRADGSQASATSWTHF